MLTNTDQLRGLKNDIIATFKEQMRLRRKLLNIDSYLLALRLESDRQRGIIADWEARHNRLYRHSAYNSRGGTSKLPIILTSHVNAAIAWPAHINWFPLISGDSADSIVDRAWEEIANIEKEEEKYVNARITSEKELEDCKNRALELERVFFGLFFVKVDLLIGCVFRAYRRQSIARKEGRFWPLWFACMSWRWRKLNCRASGW